MHTLSLDTLDEESQRIVGALYFLLPRLTTYGLCTAEFFGLNLGYEVPIIENLLKWMHQERSAVEPCVLVGDPKSPNPNAPVFHMNMQAYSTLTKEEKRSASVYWIPTVGGLRQSKELFMRFLTGLYSYTPKKLGFLDLTKDHIQIMTALGYPCVNTPTDLPPALALKFRSPIHPWYFESQEMGDLMVSGFVKNHAGRFSITDQGRRALRRNEGFSMRWSDLSKYQKAVLRKLQGSSSTQPIPYPVYLTDLYPNFHIPRSDAYGQIELLRCANLINDGDKKVSINKGEERYSGAYLTNVGSDLLKAGEKEEKTASDLRKIQEKNNQNTTSSGLSEKIGSAQVENSPRDHFENTHSKNKSPVISAEFVSHSSISSAEISLNEIKAMDYPEKFSKDTPNLPIPEASPISKKPGSDQFENSHRDYFESEKTDQTRKSANSSSISNHQEMNPNQEKISKITQESNILDKNKHQEEKNPQGSINSQKGESHEFENSPRDHFETEKIEKNQQAEESSISQDIKDTIPNHREKLNLEKEQTKIKQESEPKTENHL
jgi:hypothetical protein